MTQAGIDDVSIGTSRWFLRVDDSLPSQTEGVLARLLDGETGDGQRLHHIVGIVHHGIVSEDGLVHRACHGELEIVFMPHPHVGKVLMREDFENHARYGRQAGLAIIAVPHAPARPYRTISLGDVVLQSGQDHIGQVARSMAGYATVQLPVVEVGGIDSEGTYPFVLFREACIAMERQGQFKRHTKALVRRVIDGTSTQIVDHVATRVEVVGIVVLSIRAAIHFRWHPAPLGIVSGTFHPSGESAGLSVAGHVAHPATEAYGIGTHHTLLLALVAQYHHAIVVRALVELKVAEVHPSASTDLLVDEEFGHPTLVEDEILGIAHTIGERLIGYIYGISSCFGDVRNPLGKGLFGLLFGGCKSGATFLERVLTVFVSRSLVGESGIGSGAPFSFPALDFLIESCTIVIHDDFMALPIAFAGSEHHGSGILQHRDEVRHYERLGEQVLGGAKQSGALPSPFALLINVILAMALPEGDVTPFESLLHFIRTGDILGPWISLVFLLPHAGLVLLLQQMVGNQVFDGFSIGMDGDVVIVHGARQMLLQVAINLLHVFRCEGLVTERHRRIDI